MTLPDDLREDLRRMERRFEPDERETVYDRLPHHVAEFLKRLGRDLALVFADYPDEIANAPEPDATERYLQVVRRRYGIEEDRDAELLAAYPGIRSTDFPTVRDRVAILPGHLVEAGEVTNDEGETATELIEAGRTDEADRLLVQVTYHHLADEAQGRAVEA